MDNLFSHQYRASGIGAASCVPSRLVFDRGALPGGPGASEEGGDVVADASESVDAAPKLDTAAELAKLKEAIKSGANVKRIADAITEREEDVKQAILLYDLSEKVPLDNLTAAQKQIIQKIKTELAKGDAGKLRKRDIIFFGGTDGTPHRMWRVERWKKKKHDDRVRAFDQLEGLGPRLFPEKSRKLLADNLSKIKEYRDASTPAKKVRVVKKYSKLFLDPGGLFDLALAMMRAEKAVKDFSGSDFIPLEHEVYLDLGNKYNTAPDRKSGIWAIGEVAEVDDSHNNPPPEEERPPKREEKKDPPEKKKEEEVPPEPPKPEPKKQEPPPPEKIDTYPDIVAQLDLRQIMENARHSPGEKAWVYFGGPLKEKMPAGPKAYIIYDKEKDSFRYGFDNVPGSLEYREIVAPAENMAPGKADTWGRGGRWSYRERIDSVQQKQFKVKLSHFIAEEMKRRGLDPKVVKVEVTGDGAVVGAPPKSPAEQAAVNASVKAASEYAKERVRLDGEYEKLNKELATLGVDAKDLDISAIQRTAKKNPGAAATIYLRGELGKKMPLTMKAFVTYNSAENVFEYRFDSSGKETPDETDAGASVAQKEADLAGMKFLVTLAKKILGK